MSKGKQALASARRREQEATEALGQLRAELQQEREARVRAEHEARGKDGLLARVEELKAQIEANTSTALEQAENKIAQLRAGKVELEGVLVTKRKVEDALLNRLALALGVRTEALDALLQEVTGEDVMYAAYTNDTDSPHATAIERRRRMLARRATGVRQRPHTPRENESHARVDLCSQGA